MISEHVYDGLCLLTNYDKEWCQKITDDICGETPAEWVAECQSLQELVDALQGKCVEKCGKKLTDILISEMCEDED